MSEADNEKVCRAFFEAHVRKDVAAQMSLCSDDCVAIYPTLRRVTKAEWRSLLEHEHEAFPDAKISNLIVICQSDMAAVELDWKATFKKPYGGRPATNEQYALPCVFIIQLKNARIKLFKYYWNTGLIPNWNAPVPAKGASAAS